MDEKAMNTKKARPKNIYLLSAVVVVLLLGSLLGYAYWKPKQPSDSNNEPGIAPVNTINYSEPTKDELEAGEQIKQDSISNSADPSAGNPSNEKIDIAIIFANRSGDHIRIQTQINIITNSGSCSLSGVGPDGQAYQASAEVQAMPSFSTCKGFSVPVDALAPGHWIFTVTYSDEGKAGSAKTELHI